MSLTPTHAISPQRLKFGNKTSPQSSPASDALADTAKQNGGGKVPENGVWVTTERTPAITGGLGEVSKTIPDAFATKMPEVDMRIIIPYLPLIQDDDRRKKAENKSEEAFSETKMAFKMKDGEGVNREFKVLQKFEPAAGTSLQQGIGNWVYAIKEDNYFASVPEGQDPNKTKSKSLHLYTYNPDAGEFDKIMMFNRAAAKLIPLLKGNNPQSAGKGLHRFGEDPRKNFGQKQVDFVMAHDWLTGPVLHELPDDPNTRKIFMLHNRYDKVQIPTVAKTAGMFTPDTLYENELLYSPLHLGISSADAVIGELNFVKTLLTTDFGKGAQFVKALKEKQDANLIFNMHHGLSETFTAIGQKAPKGLTEDFATWKAEIQGNIRKLEAEPTAGNKQKAERLTAQLNRATEFKFEKLQTTGDLPPTKEQIGAFKAHNKEQLQKKWGLDVGRDKILMGWAARLEPEQKGVFLLQNAMNTILENRDKNPDYDKVQFIIFGPTEDPTLLKWVKTINERYPGRVFMPNDFASRDTIAQLTAGSDFTILPSLYEPYGLTQLEAMKMGSIPVVHGVDGLRSTVNDPEIVKAVFKDQLNGPAREAVWDQPQNGVLMEPLSINRYLSYIRKRQEWEGMEAVVNQPEGRLSLPQLKMLLETFKKAEKQKSAQVQELNLKENLATEKKQTPLFNQQEQGIQGKLQKDIQDLKNLQRQLDRSNQLTASQKEKIEALFKPNTEDDLLNEHESAKLTKAIARGLQLITEDNGEKALQIRKNALDFVNTVHSWPNIVKDRYAKVIEGSRGKQSLRQPRPQPTNSDTTASATRSINTVASKPLNVRTFEKKTETPPSMMKQSFFWIENVWKKIYQIIGYILRPFALKQD